MARGQRGVAGRRGRGPARGPGDRPAARQNVDHVELEGDVGFAVGAAVRVGRQAQVDQVDGAAGTVEGDAGPASLGVGARRRQHDREGLDRGGAHGPQRRSRGSEQVHPQGGTDVVGVGPDLEGPLGEGLAQGRSRARTTRRWCARRRARGRPRPGRRGRRRSPARPACRAASGCGGARWPAGPGRVGWSSTSGVKGSTPSWAASSASEAARWAARSWTLQPGQRRADQDLPLRAGQLGQQRQPGARPR